jgi:hypothetical protein
MDKDRQIRMLIPPKRGSDEGIVLRQPPNEGRWLSN